jgi:hypothetical protein
MGRDNIPKLLSASAEQNKGRFRQFGFSSIGALLLSIGAVAAGALLTVVTALFIA